MNELELASNSQVAGANCSPLVDGGELTFGGLTAARMHSCAMNPQTRGVNGIAMVDVLVLTDVLMTSSIESSCDFLPPVDLLFLNAGRSDISNDWRVN